MRSGAGCSPISVFADILVLAIVCDCALAGVGDLTSLSPSPVSRAMGVADRDPAGETTLPPLLTSELEDGWRERAARAMDALVSRAKEKDGLLPLDIGEEDRVTVLSPRRYAEEVGEVGGRRAGYESVRGTMCSGTG